MIRKAARCVAAEAIAVAEADAVSEDQRLALQAAALGWLSYAALPATSMPRDPRQYAREAAERSLDGMARAWKGALLNRRSMLTTYPFSDGEEAPLFREFEEQQEDVDNPGARQRRGAPFDRRDGDAGGRQARQGLPWVGRTAVAACSHARTSQLFAAS